MRGKTPSRGKTRMTLISLLIYVYDILDTATGKAVGVVAILARTVDSDMFTTIYEIKSVSCDFDTV